MLTNISKLKEENRIIHENAKLIPLELCKEISKINGVDNVVTFEGNDTCFSIIVNESYTKKDFDEAFVKILKDAFKEPFNYEVMYTHLRVNYSTIIIQI